MSNDAGTAASLLSSLVAAEASIWGYYFIVLAGLTAGIITLTANNYNLGNVTRGFITFSITLFTIVNTASLWQTGKQINKLVQFISTKDSELGKVIAPMDLPGLAIVLGVAGMFGLILWIWLYDNNYIKNLYPKPPP